MIQENTDILRKSKGCKVFFHSRTIENRKALIMCRCPAASGALPRKVSAGVNDNRAQHHVLQADVSQQPLPGPPPRGDAENLANSTKPRASLKQDHPFPERELAVC